jgi:hypothetical protein
MEIANKAKRACKAFAKTVQPLPKPALTMVRLTKKAILSHHPTVVIPAGVATGMCSVRFVHVPPPANTTAKNTKKVTASHPQMVATPALVPTERQLAQKKHATPLLVMDAQETPAPKRNTAKIQIAVDLTTAKEPVNHAHKIATPTSILFVDVTAKPTTTSVKPLLLAFPTSTKANAKPHHPPPAAKRQTAKNTKTAKAGNTVTVVTPAFVKLEKSLAPMQCAPPLVGHAVV